jgi:hypothetical protein
MTLLLFAGACLGAAMVHGASRGTTRPDILRETWRSFVSLAGGIALLCAAIWGIVSVAQA